LKNKNNTCKLFVYNCKTNQEKGFFKKYAKQFELEVGFTSEVPSIENVDLANGYDYINVMISHVSKEMLEKWNTMGIKMISTRTVGYDHFDVESAKEIGIHLGNSAYPPDAVAEYAIMLMLMTCRNVKLMLQKGSINDYTLGHLPTTNMREKKIGIIGTGKIGAGVVKKVKNLCKEVLMYDIVENDEVTSYGTYCDLDTIFKTCDIISLHIPAFDETKHIVNAERLAMMKSTAVIVNTARGDLIDTKALIKALQEKTIAGAGLDVVEGETGIVFHDFSHDILSHEEMAILQNMPNVIFTPHAAYYTSTSMEYMIMNSLKTLILPKNKDENPWLIV